MTGASRLEDRALQFLGLIRRAGKLVTGTEATRQAVRDGEAHLVVLALDAAPGQLEKVRGILRHRAIPEAVWATRTDLGRAVGQPPLSALAITNEIMARQLQARLAEGLPPSGSELPRGR
ncbi:MAG: L7Ae/L30e/S12e/Gadd45 family ribosomal protein [Gemmatimonadota bacterium]